MKKILLSSAAIVAFAGAAAAEVTWSGDAKLGYNNEMLDGATTKTGTYWEAGLGVKLSQELNNGWSASASLDVDLGNGAGALSGITVDASDWVVTIENDMFSLSAGDVDTAAESFKFASEIDGGIKDDAEDYASTDAGLLLKATVGQFSVAASAVHPKTAAQETGAFQLVVNGDFGNISAGLLYAQEETQADIAQGEALMVSLGASLGGADLTFNAGKVADQDRYGIKVSYPTGPVTIGAFYSVVKTAAAGDDEDAYGADVVYKEGALEAKAYYQTVAGSDEYGLGAQYDLGNGLKVTGGYVDGDSTSDDDFGAYIAAEYDLGGGASFTASYADGKAGGVGSDDIDTVVGGYELNDGLTLELALKF